ncbi:hypothetical protein ACLOJK_040695 [Asimina triloba]
MSVADYEIKFLALTCFAPNLVTDEEARIRRFQNRLDESIRDMVMAEPCEMYSKAVDRAMWAEKADRDQRVKGLRIRSNEATGRNVADVISVILDVVIFNQGHAISAEKLVIGQTTVPMEWCVTGVVCRDIPLSSVLRQVQLVHSSRKTRIG